MVMTVRGYLANRESPLDGGAFMISHDNECVTTRESNSLRTENWTEVC